MTDQFCGRRGGNCQCTSVEECINERQPSPANAEMNLVEAGDDLYSAFCGYGKTKGQIEALTNYANASNAYRGGVIRAQSTPVDPLADLVDRFSKALLAKLRLTEANGRSGWERDDWEQQCQQGLLRHIEKGDPRDVAAYCAFMWHHGWITSSASPGRPAMTKAQMWEPCRFCGSKDLSITLSVTCNGCGARAAKVLWNTRLAAQADATAIQPQRVSEPHWQKCPSCGFVGQDTVFLTRPKCGSVPEEPMRDLGGPTTE